MRLLNIIFCVLFFSAFSFGQEAVAVKLDSGCGNPLTESQLYQYRFGKVTGVTPDNCLTVNITHSNNAWDDPAGDHANTEKLSKPQIFTVSLVGVNMAVNGKAIGDFLRKNLVDQNVTITGNRRKGSGLSLNALVEFTLNEELEEISEYLIERGIAKFNNFKHVNTVPMMTACELKEAEKRARDARLGLWSAK